MHADALDSGAFGRSSSIIEAFEPPTATPPEGRVASPFSFRPDPALNHWRVLGGARYETCRAIMDAQGLMPEEIARPFTCTAFPQTTLIGRFWVIIIISCILVPVQMCAAPPVALVDCCVCTGRVRVQHVDGLR